ncbi:hypothetical protein ACJJTC_019797 [Scirpophaga incertulas]
MVDSAVLNSILIVHVLCCFEGKLKIRLNFQIFFHVLNSWHDIYRVFIKYYFLIEESNMSSNNIVQYVLLRSDLLKELGWSIGALVAQACHASSAVIHLNRYDEQTIKYLDDLDNMHKVVLEVPNEDALRKVAAKLQENSIAHKLWIEQPENVPTCLAIKPYPKDEVKKYVGFTGKHAVKNLIRIIKESPELANVTWGISGRSKEKIQNLLKEIESYGDENLRVPVIECDIKKTDVREVSKRAKILVNCTGPNTVLSESIVKACLETGTHYVDISAELFHMLNLYRNFNKAAEDSNVVIVPACGFAVVPAAAALMVLNKEFNGTLNTVESYAELLLPKRAYFPGPNKCLVHYGTWASLVHEFQNYQEYRRLKQETFPQNIYGLEPREMKRSFFHRNNGRVWFPYPGPEVALDDMSQRYLHSKSGKKPYHFKMYTTTPLFLHLLAVVPAFFSYYILSHLKCFRNLLWKFPRLFTVGYVSHKGPTEKMAQDTKYVMNFAGKGLDKNSKEKVLSVKVSGTDPGYETTAITLVVCALTILTESSNIPKGGVLGVGAAFQNTELVANLIKSKGLVMEIKAPNSNS